MYAGLLLCSHHSDDLLSGVYLPHFLQNYGSKKCRFPHSALPGRTFAVLCRLFPFCKGTASGMLSFRFLQVLVDYCRLLPVIFNLHQAYRNVKERILYTHGTIPLHCKLGLRCKERNFRKKGRIKEVETSLT